MSTNGHRTCDPWLYPKEQTRNEQLDPETAALEIRLLLANSTGHVYSDEELAAAAEAAPIAHAGEAVAFDEALLRASHRLFKKSEDQQDKTRLFVARLLAVAQWGGDLPGFLEHWRLRQIEYRDDGGLLAEVIQLQHEGKDEDYVVRYITDRYDLADD